MITKNSFVPGRVYSVVYASAVDMVSKRDVDYRTTEGQAFDKHYPVGVRVESKGKTNNPLDGKDVTVRRVSTIQAAGEKTWQNYLAKRGEEPTGRPTFWTVSKDNSCIVVGTTANTLGVEYLRGLPRGITSEQYFVNGTPATESEVAAIRAFRKNASSGNEFVILSLSKLQNVDSGEGEAE